MMAAAPDPVSAPAPHSNPAWYVSRSERLSFIALQSDLLCRHDFVAEDTRLMC